MHETQSGLWLPLPVPPAFLGDERIRRIIYGSHVDGILYRWTAAASAPNWATHYLLLPATMEAG
jgi:hypothetical protein